MDSTDALQQNKKRRLKYDRETLLAVKKNAPLAELNIYDSLTRVSAASVCQRGARGKARASTTSKVQNGCTRDSSSIVLGPQKRTWNTGCHVSHPSGRDSSDLYGSGSRGGKGGSDYRFPDRGHPRGSNDYKREFRGGHGLSRDRGMTRRTDGVAFCRSQTREDRHTRDGRMSFQEEPEWFSEGPTTVSETIELGGILEEFGDDEAATLCVERSGQQSDVVACVGDRKMSSDNVGSELEKESDHVSTNLGASRDEFQVPANTISHLDLFDSLQIPKTTTSQGSRFKHLFAKSEREATAPKNNINDQLLQLLRGASTQGGSLHDKNNVIQVENKLRSILLGHNGPRTEDNRNVSSENKNTKPQVLTVEEIEAQLNSPHNNQTSEVRSTTADRIPVTVPEKTTDEIFKHFAPGPNVGSNLAPILQSLALKQHQQQQQQQQQAVCAQSVQLRSALSTIGMLSNPMVRLPTSANAVSASARINQLQQADISTNPGMSELGPGQQAIRHTWDGGLTAGSQMPPQHLLSNIDPLSATSSRPLGPNHGQLTDFGSRSIFGSVNPTNPSTTNAPRRPIVKVQQPTISNHSCPSLSPFVTSNNINPSGISGPNLSDVDRRLLNFALKQQQVNLTEPRGISDRFPMGPTMHSVAPGEVRYPPPGLHQNTGSPLIYPIANTNNSAFLASHARSNIQSDTALAFLSQLVERDRVACPRPNFGPFLTSGIKAKTLEEIEHQEVTSSGSFL